VCAGVAFQDGTLSVTYGAGQFGLTAPSWNRPHTWSRAALSAAKTIKGSVSVGYANLEPEDQSEFSLSIYGAYKHGASVSVGADSSGSGGQPARVNFEDWGVQYQRGFAGGYTTESSFDLLSIGFIRDLEYFE
jgi:hypothetical protein